MSLQKNNGQVLTSSQQVMLKCPLAFEPGTGWTYGEGIDWAGEAVRQAKCHTIPV